MNNFYPFFFLLALHGIDMLSGLISAIKNKQLQSCKLRDGLFKKVGFILCYLVAYLVDNYSSYVAINLELPILPIISTYTAVTEIVSIFENITKISPNIVPKKILDLIKKGEE